MKLRIKMIAVAVATVIPFMAQAEGNFFSDIQYEVNAGTNIGGASPIPLTSEIRQIVSYTPNLNLLIGGTVTKMFGPDRRWGVAVSARLGTKGMKTKACVKNYGMEMLSDGNILSGRWTGRVQTKYHTQQLVIPITAVWQAKKRLKVNFGPYLSYAFSNEFSGHVYDGYLRAGDPTGEKYVFEGESKATYDFSENLRRFQWGFQGGVSWTPYRHLSVNANLTWGCNSIFVSSFKTVTFNMYPIYLNMGFGYVF